MDFLTIIKVRKLPLITLKLTWGANRETAQHKAFRAISKKLTFLTSFPWVNMKSREHLGGVLAEVHLLFMRANT